jgi:hypothetical protein
MVNRTKVPWENTEVINADGTKVWTSADGTDFMRKLWLVLQ